MVTFIAVVIIGAVVLLGSQLSAIYEDAASRF